MKLDALRRKRDEIEKQIREAEAAEKRTAGLVTAIQKSGALALTDEQILSALTAAVKAASSLAASQNPQPAAP